jgi:hypothetical protein
MFFTGKDDGPSIEEFIKDRKSSKKENWKDLVVCKLQGDATIWWKSLNYNKMMALSDEEFEKLFLDKWSHAKKNDKERNKGLFSCGNSILQVHGCIQQEKVIVSINPSCMHNFINVNLVKGCKYLQIIFKAHRLKVKIFKILKI